MNTLVITPLRYSAAFLDYWNYTKSRRGMGRRMRKLMAMYSNSDIDRRLHIPRKEERRCLMSVKDFVSLAVLGLENFVKSSH